MRIYTRKLQEVISRQITDDNEVKGNLVYAMVNNSLFLSFDDGRWACYRWYAWPEGGGGIELMEGTPEYYELREACIISYKDHEEQETLLKEHYQKSQRERELGTLKKLKKKYE